MSLKASGNNQHNENVRLRRNENMREVYISLVATFPLEAIADSQNKAGSRKYNKPGRILRSHRPRKKNQKSEKKKDLW